jgi:UDP-glucose 4-epimerase
VEKLLLEGHEVHVLDNFSTGREENLNFLSRDLPLTLFEGSVQNAAIVNKAMDGCNYVFHLAALADIVPSIQDPLKYYATNCGGTAVVMDAARRVNPFKVVYAASSSCYGLPELFPTPENSTINPQYPYALTKWIGEQITLHWGKVYRIPTVSLRLFNVYGPRSRTSGTYGAVFGVFLAQKLAGKPMTVVGDGEQSRDFTFVADVVDAFYAAAVSNIHLNALNVGSGKSYSVNSLVELLGGERCYIPKRPGEPDKTFADISAITQLLNWRPKISLDQGVAKMLLSIDYWKDAPVWEPTTIADATQDWFKYLEFE